MLTAIVSGVGVLMVLIFIVNRRVLPRALANAPESTKGLAARMNTGIAICGVALVLLAVFLLVLSGSSR